ncbi:MAG: putative Rhs family protein, partial [Armatimonadetes bacterium]|nr:putative Rhs family protein [Armatimonadota bacterium]
NTRNREVGYTYDSYHNLTGVTLNGVSQGTIAYTYGPDNRTIVKARATNALGDATETELISFGRPVKYTAFHRTGGGQPYDLKTQWLYHNTGPGDLFSATVFTSPRTYTTRFTYGDVVPSGAPHTAGAAAPPGVPKTVTDPLGRVYTSDFDALGRPIRAFSPPNLLPLANDPAPSVGSVQYGPDGAPWRVTDPLGRVSEVTYNGLGGGLLEITSHLVGVADTTSKTIVNAAGNVVQVIDPRGVETTCTYNGDGQVLTVEQASGTADARVTQYRYDTHGNLSELVPPKGEESSRWCTKAR